MSYESSLDCVNRQKHQETIRYLEANIASTERSQQKREQELCHLKGGNRDFQLEQIRKSERNVNEMKSTLASLRRHC